jgi:hypothetical protein
MEWNNSNNNSSRSSCQNYNMFRTFPYEIQASSQEIREDVENVNFILPNTNFVNNPLFFIVDFFILSFTL